MKLDESKHASSDWSQFKSKQAKWSKSHIIHGWKQVASKRTSNDWAHSNLSWQVEASRKQACCSWNHVESELHVIKVRVNMHSWMKQVESKHASMWSSQFESNFVSWN